MPRGDRTGPLGQGPQTGRGLGLPGPGIENNAEPDENIGIVRRLEQSLGIGRGGQGRGRKTGRSQGRGRGGQGRGRNR